MSDKPWLTDPKYGGMSENAARLSYEAWLRQGKRTLPRGTVLPAPDAEIAVIKRSIAVQLNEYEAAIKAASDWHTNWLTTRPKGFRAARRRSATSAPSDADASLPGSPVP